MLSIVCNGIYASPRFWTDISQNQDISVNQGLIGVHRVVGGVTLFFLCLLGGLAQAGLPQGFRAIYRDTAQFIW